MNLGPEVITRMGNMMAFELGIWRDRGWFYAKNYNQLINMALKDDFNSYERLLGKED